VLPGLGRVSREQADRIAQEQYSRFADRRRSEAELAAEAALNQQLQAVTKQLPSRPDPT
jgi:hypothetical protein